MKFGAQTHFAQFHDQRLIPLLANAGIKHIRDEQYWHAIENPKGTFTFPQKFTDYMAKATASGVEPFICLSFANQFYDYQEGLYTGPHTDAGRAGFANYALKILQKYPQIKAVEVWNEYNAGSFIKGPATANKPLYYKLMLQKVYETIKPKYPHVKVVAGATVPVAHGFLRDLFAQGAMPYLDAISVHYPSNVEVEIAGVRDLIKQYNGGKEKPIWVTEFSRVASSEADRPLTATYIAQTVALMLSQRVERMYYYLAIDDSNFPFWGLFGSPATNFKEHPGLVAYRTAIQQYSQIQQYRGRYATSPSVYAYKFYHFGTLRQLSVLWTVRPVTVELVSTVPLTVVSEAGATTTLTPANNKVLLALTNKVQYVIGPVGNTITEIGNDLLADSVSGYSKTAGRNGWTYGYAAVPAVYNLALFRPMVWALYGSDKYVWKHPVSLHPIGGGSSMHPGDGGDWAIRRWKSNYAGAVQLEGTISRGSGGDGSGVRIFVDGVEVYNKTVLPSQTFNYSVPVTLKLGGLVDFTVSRLGNSAFDSTQFTAQIIKR